MHMRMNRGQDVERWMSNVEHRYLGRRSMYVIATAFDLSIGPVIVGR